MINLTNDYLQKIFHSYFLLEKTDSVKVEIKQNFVALQDNYIVDKMLVVEVMEHKDSKTLGWLYDKDVNYIFIQSKAIAIEREELRDIAETIFKEKKFSIEPKANHLMITENGGVVGFIPIEKVKNLLIK